MMFAGINIDRKYLKRYCVVFSGDILTFLTHKIKITTLNDIY